MKVKKIIDRLLEVEYKGPEWVQLCEELNRNGGWEAAARMNPKALGKYFLRRKHMGEAKRGLRALCRDMVLK